MRIEDATKKKLNKVSDGELYSLRLRFTQLWQKSFGIPITKEGFSLSRKGMIEKYKLLTTEMNNRGLTCRLNTSIDSAVFKAAMAGIDVPSLPEILISEDFLCLAGDYVTNPKGVHNSVDVVIKNKDALDSVAEQQLISEIVESFPSKDRDKIVLHHLEKGEFGENIPLYDLFLKPKDTSLRKSGAGVWDMVVKQDEEEAKPWDSQLVNTYAHIIKAVKGEKVLVFASSPYNRILPAMKVYGFDKLEAAFTSSSNDSYNKDNLKHAKKELGIKAKLVDPLLENDFSYADNSFDTVVSYYFCSSMYDREKEYIAELVRIAKERVVIVEIKSSEDSDMDIAYNIDKGKKTDIAKPFPTEHSARLKSPGQYSEFRRQNNKLGSGIHVIYGIKVKAGKRVSEIQAIRFDKKKFTVAEAKAWLKEHDFKSILFEPAVSKVEKMTEKNLLKLLEGYAETGVSRSKDDFIAVIDVKGGLIGETGQAEEDTEFNKEFRFMKIDKVEHVIGGIIYLADEEDAAGDFTDAEEIRLAMYGYMENSQKIKIMHRGAKQDISILECFQSESDGTEKGGIKVAKGAWWLTIRVNNVKIWNAVTSGVLKGFSMGGRARSE